MPQSRLALRLGALVALLLAVPAIEACGPPIAEAIATDKAKDAGYVHPLENYGTIVSHDH